MSKYYYKKGHVEYAPKSNFYYVEQLEPLKKKKTKLKSRASLKAKDVIPLYYRVNSGKYFKSIFKLSIGVLGLAILVAVFSPLVLFYLNQNFFNKYSQSFINSVPSSQIDAASIGSNNIFTLNSDPSADYFKKVVENGNLTSSSISKKVPDYFTISIPSIKLTDLKVKTNVESSNADSYLSILKNSVAHFKGTSLPGQSGNTFIYGHSSVEWYHLLFPNSFEGIFTDLTQMNIGDTMTVNYSGKKYIYEVFQTQIVGPSDFSVLKSNPNEKILTLMTCIPPGIGTQRLIVKAIQEN